MTICARSRSAARFLASFVATFALSASLGACDDGPSTLTVHNRTTTPIVFSGAYDTGDHFVDACSTSVLTWHGDWASDRPANERLPSAVRYPAIRVSPFEYRVQVWIVITGDGGRQYSREADVPDPLPGCLGVYAAPTPAPTRSPQPTEPPIFLPVQQAGVVVRVDGSDTVATMTLVDQQTVDVTPNRRALGGAWPDLGDLLIAGDSPARWLDRAPPITGSNVPIGCYGLVGDAFGVEGSVLVGREAPEGDVFVLLRRLAIGSTRAAPTPTTCSRASAPA